MKLNVHLFAVARQQVGQNAVEVELSPAATVAQLRGALVERYPALAGVIGHSRFAVNSEYAGESTRLSAGSEVALIPPVSGG